MCGIAGFLRAEGVAAPADKAILGEMASLIRHRGPDDEDVWVGAGVGFAHRRLAVIDPTPHGRQPMSRGDGRWTLTFNGEIYNYRELRRELEALGERFSTSTDTEVLLAALIRWGAGALVRLNGMFALAFWDAASRRLLLARDRMGEKPLYFAQVRGGLVFGSEIKAILAWPGLERRANLQAIHHYLSLQYVPAPFTAFEGVHKLPAASYVEVSPGEEPVPVRYWALPAPPLVLDPASPQDAAALAHEARERLEAAVQRRLVADVPVGTFLSGGLDSSAVTALMALHSGAPVKTFTIGFQADEYDERAFARTVAERYGTDHHEEVVDVSAAELLPKLVWHYGEPFADPSAIPTYLVSQLARRHVTVALTGDGGDEFFLGYGRYADCLAMGWVDRIPSPLRRAADWSARAIPESLARRRYVRGGRRLLQLSSLSGARRYEPAMMYFQGSDKREGYGPALRPFLTLDTLDLLEPYFSEASGMVAGAAWADIHTYLPDDLMVKVDVASMASGLECRAPFLDVELMEWAARIPAATKLLDGALKGLLKTAVEPLLPAEVVRRPKMGFGAPIDHWLRDDLFEMAEEILEDPRAQARGLFKPGYARQLLEEHRTGKRHHHPRIWAMIMLELWHRAWIDPAAAPLGPKADLVRMKY